MSCGFLLLISGHKRFAHKMSTPLYHQVSTGFWGKVQDMEEKLEEAKRLQKQIEDYTTERTKIGKKKLKEILENKKDWYMSSTEALELGVVDEILK
jgi:ATP-dependent Clp protease protease subunit